MLNSFRKISNNIIIKSILVLVAISFVLWGVGDILRSGYRGDVASIKNVGDITIVDLERQVNKELYRIQAMTGKTFTKEEIESFGIKKHALQRLVYNKLLAKQASDLGIVISDKEIVDFIAKNPEFKTNNKFDKIKFNKLLRDNLFTENEYFKAMKQEMSVDLLIRSITYNIPVQGVIIDKLSDVYRQYRIVNELRFTNDFKFNVNVTEDEIKNYYDINKENFKTSEYRDFKYLMLNQNIFPSENVSPEDLKKTYEENKDKYVLPEKRNIINIIFNNEEKANDARMKLSGLSGENFLKQAEILSGNKAKDLIIEDIAIDNLVEELKPSYNLEVGKLSDVIKTSLGYHLVMVTKVTDSRIATLKEVEAEIKGLYQSLIIEKEKADLTAKIEDSISEGKTIEQIAQENNLQLNNISGVSKNLTDKNNQPIKFLEENNKIASLIFSSNKGELSEIITNDYGQLYIVEVSNIIPEDYKNLDSVKQEISSIIIDNKKLDYINSVRSSIIDEGSDKKAMLQVAKKLGVEVINERVDISKDVSIIDNSKNWPNVIFNLKKGDVSPVFRNKGNYIIAILESVSINENMPKQEEALKSGLYDQNFDEIMQQLLVSLLDKYEVKIFDRAEQK